jgi:hypothetical protein
MKPVLLGFRDIFLNFGIGFVLMINHYNIRAEYSTVCYIAGQGISHAGYFNTAHGNIIGCKARFNVVYSYHAVFKVGYRAAGYCKVTRTGIQHYRFGGYTIAVKCCIHNLYIAGSLQVNGHGAFSGI